MGYAIWNLNIPCVRFRTWGIASSGGVILYELAVKNLTISLQILVQSTTEDLGILCGSVQWATTLEINSNSVKKY